MLWQNDANCGKTGGMSYLRFMLVWAMITFVMSLILLNVDKPAKFGGREYGRLAWAAVLGVVGAYFFFSRSS